MVSEARVVDGPNGKTPEGNGWFVINARESEWLTSDDFGAGMVFRNGESFRHYGINIQVIWPGQPNCYYHAEEGQEDFLILSGECVLLVEGQERRLKPWDFVHCPPFTEHVFVGAGDGPCTFLGVGARNAGDGLVYPVSELALRHRAGVKEEATSGKVAYAGSAEPQHGPCQEGFLPDR
jgi:uncharacterized cupin superfamily protein